ncbi:MAG: succinate dehydrogenase cytochrome b subunit [Acidimicrobiia bacterium]|nr:succinate dehydrogenase cytochrome b subunit [Acidimicrobiia bacterium]
MAVTTRSEKRQAPWLVEFYRSAVGKKWVMAITGIVWMGYLFAHMVGNLKVYIGFLPEESAYEIDLYGEALRELLFPIMPHHAVLWLFRIGLIVALVFHVHAAYSLTVMNRRARTVDYQGPREYLAANYASRTMRYSGVLVLLFIFWHLADFTWGIAPFAPESWEHGAVYANFVATFSRVPVAILYIVANLAMGIHLYHGAWSLFQSLGVNHPKFNPWRRYFAMGFTAIIVIPNVSFPIAVLTGIVS